MIEKEKIESAIKEIEVNLNAKKKLSNIDLLEICNRGKAGGIANSNDSHLAHEAMEVAVNNFISENYCRSNFLESCENLRILTELKELEKRIPVQSWRSIEQQQFQQFSTPPTVAFLTTKILNPLKTDLILEPSAGTGSLTAWLRMVGCNVQINELSERRRAMLELQGYHPTAHNAEFLDDLLPGEIRPDGVLMNPPFSSSSGRTKNNDSNFGFRHVKSALTRLKTGGRLVALLGSDALTKTDKGLSFLSEIATEYDLKAVINLPKNAFYKYGTTLPTTIICIRKSEPKLPANRAKSLKYVLNTNCRSLEDVLNYTSVFD